MKLGRQEGFGMTLCKKLLVYSLVFSLSVPTLLATEPVILQTGDVVLQDGVMRGTVLDQSSRPVVGMPVRLFYRETQIAEAFSNDRGEFSISGLRNGSHILASGSNRSNIRFWGAEAAPPSATQKAMILVGNQIVSTEEYECVEEPARFKLFGGNALMGSELARPAMMLAVAGGVVGIVSICDKKRYRPYPKPPVSP